MAGWESLRLDLLRIREESPRAFVVYPDPHTERRHERQFRIRLAAWATGIAEELHTKYGELVDLQVGALGFPGKELRYGEQIFEMAGEPAEVVGLTVEAPSPLTIRSGYFAKLDVLVTNRADHQQTLVNVRSLHTAVTDSAGAVVGRYAGLTSEPRTELAIDPGQTLALPARVGTASLVPTLGYAVPPGRWSLVVSLITLTGFYLSLPLELTITP
ncbi:hypothetical protein ACQHIV_33310 [Kribbella sp. GL6]|uniref:hypothetical protein n=1 Tax=Kribbella sp. GL6 TaxID=3419765 RepID=UPI003CFD4FA4